MRKISVMETGFALILLLSSAGCDATYQAPGAVEVQIMPELESEPLGTESPLSPVIQDVYDLSIPADVYSDH